METFVTYKKPQLSKIENYIPPPYCRKADRRKNGFEELPSLNLIVSNPSKLLALYEKLNDNASKSLEVKINSYLMKEGECISAFLIYLLPLVEEAMVQTVGKEELETSCRVPVSRDVMSQLVQYENGTLKCDYSLNPQIVAIFDKIFGDLKLKIISVPILRKENYYPCSAKNIVPPLIACFVESKKDENYLIKLANELFQYCSPVLINMMAAEEETRQKRQHQSLVAATYKFYSYMDDINELLKVITSEAKQLTNAQKCSLYLVNPDDIHLVLKIFNLSEEKKIKANVKLTVDYAIPDHVATTGELFNTQNSTDQVLMDKSLTEFTGFTTRNILCFPIKNENNIIGVIQLCNKRGGDFNTFDEEIANILSIHCGLAITKSLKFTQLQNFKIRSQLSDGLMTHHVSVDEEEAVKKVSCPLIHYHPDFELFTFSPRVIVEMETVCYVLKMFDNLGFFETFGIKKNAFARFVMTIKNCCCEVPYHNWMHLFSAAHFAYLCLKHLELVEKGYITHLEALAYFMTCLCHDVDYRAANNPFQQKPGDHLGVLYSSPGSVMERHRLSQVLRILNSEGCNFLEVLEPKSYCLFLDLLKDVTMATDLATHFKFYRKQYYMSQGGYDRNNPEHRYVFTSLLTTCADLSDHTKEWLVSKNAAAALFEEFFIQGDLEKRFEKDPVRMKETEVIFLPDVQVKFLTQVCLPVFKLLANMFISLKELVHAIKRNILYWEASKHIFLKAMDEGRSCMDVLKTEEFDNEIEATIQILEAPK